MASESTAVKEPGEAGADRELTRSGTYYRPRVDILEAREELMLVADMPGVSPEKIDIHFERGVLEIWGRVPHRQTANTRFLRREYGVGDFYRSFQVSEEIDASRIAADYKDGVLTVHLPKSSSAKPRKIPVASV